MSNNEVNDVVVEVNTTKDDEKHDNHGILYYYTII